MAGSANAYGGQPATPGQFYDQWSQAGINSNGQSYAGPSAFAQAQTALGRAQASAVHDPLQAAQLTENDKMARFNSILPLLTNQFSRLNNGFATAGGSNGAPPPITAGPVLNPQQIQQQVNQSRAANDQNTAGQIARSDASLAGRGFGSGSPLSMALNGAMQGQNMATNTANETNTRLNAAQQNASQLLNSQQALSNQWATGNQLDIQRRAPIFAQQNALIAALSGLV